MKARHSVAVPGADTAATSVEVASLTGQAVLASNDTLTKKKRGRGVKPPHKLLRHITQAMIQWNMAEEGDRLLLGLSGGKDSLSLLHCLLEFQRKLPINFEIEVCTIDPMTPSFDPSPLIPYVESLGLKYHYIRDDIVARANTSGKDGKVVSSLCAFCARMKRGHLYTCARRNNCNKLVLAQHLDDCAESFLMSAMHNGFLRTMKAHYQINAGDLSVIRPMVYCRESLMTDFAKAANLPVINENCPACFDEPKERARIKKLLAREETLYPNLHDNICRSLIPLMHDDITAILRCYLEEAVSKSRKNDVPKNTKGGNARKGKRGVNVVSEEKKEEQDVSGAASAISAPAPLTDATHNSKRIKTVLAEASDEDLVKELARRKVEKFHLAKIQLEDDTGDPTGQVCSLNGGDGSIPCCELME
jgi:tRNA(Ile)-lysidine synthase TilS/MesJ